MQVFVSQDNVERREGKVHYLKDCLDIYLTFHSCFQFINIEFTKPCSSFILLTVPSVFKGHQVFNFFCKDILIRLTWEYNLHKGWASSQEGNK